MQKIHTSIVINAPAHKVWDTMLSANTYPEWTKVFSPTPDTTSRFEGDWSEGSTMRFIGTDEKGNEGGMVSRIAESRPHEYLSIEHVGIITNGVEDRTSDAAKQWAPAFENYTFEEKDGGTELTIDQDMNDDYAEGFTAAWDEALKTLKELSEKE